MIIRKDTILGTGRTLWPLRGWSHPPKALAVAPPATLLH